ncbi:hypothetical protein ABE52_21780 [Bacillus thuringiensis]|uniref:Uncharacterized protein n=1 Tax=Bacillus thuringiensis YBT-1518 TaxID=529122 RepID=A0A9W3KA20_BACTU|nr:hypothetical protein [Bacillus thuringiensis]AHA69966.1 hypothetical protein YBT1518_03735 [Bacillus thuringiensis YBT-1518]MBG9484676.1 hypothetical protein [Bacillus thuringiensis]
MSQPLTKHSLVVGKSGEGMGQSYMLEGENSKLVKAKEYLSQERLQEDSYEAEETFHFFRGCKNACLLAIPTWIAILLIWFL